MIKTFTKYILTLVALLCISSNAWAECYVLNEPDEVEYRASDNGSCEFTLNGPGATLSFEASKGMHTAVGDIYVEQYINGWTEIDHFMPSGKNEWNKKTYDNKISRYATKIRVKSYSGSYRRFFRNFLVTQATYVDAPMAGGSVVTEWNAGSSIVGDNVSASATIDWSNTVFSWELQGNTDNQFSVNFSSTGATCAYGQSTITATYHRTQPGTHSATLKIFTVSGDYTIAFNGVTDKYTPLAEQKQDELILNNSYSPSELFKVYYIANNVEQTISDYTITPLTPEIANYVDGKIVTNYRSGEAKFQLTRGSNDSFYPLEKTISFNVAASGETCDVPLSQTSFTVKYVNTDGNTNGTFSDIITLPISGCGETLSFYYCVTTNANNDHYLTPQYSPDASGNDWRDLGTRQTYNSTTPKYHSVTIDNAARRIRFKRTGANKNAQRDFNITSVTITRKQFLQATDNNGAILSDSNPLILPTVMKGSNAANTTFNFKWSACSDIKLTCDNSKFTISTTDITTDEGNSTITVSCNTSTEGTFSGTITIYSQEQVVSFPVTCTVNNKWETDVISGQTSQTMLVDGTWETDFVFPANNASTFPTEDGDFYYTISHDLGDNAHLKDGYTDKVITYENGIITAHNAGTAVLTIGHKETSTNFASKKEFQCTITVGKYTPTFTWNESNTPYYYGTNIPNIFSSTNSECPYTIVSDNEAFAKVVDNTLYIANYRETAKITVTQEENYKWNGKTETYPITPVNGNKHVPFTITDANYNLLKYSTTGSVSWSDGKVRFQQGGFNWDDSYYDIQFEGIPDILTFNYDAQDGATGLEWFVQESSNGTDWESIENGSSTSNSGSISVTLQSSTRFLRFCYSGNLSGKISNINVTERFQFEAMPTALDFGTNGINHGQQEEDVTFLHANAGRITEAVISGTDKDYFSVSPTTIPGTGRDLYGTTTLKVTFDNKYDNRGANPYNATLTIKDNAGRKIDIPLKGIRDGQSTPVFVWNPNALPYYFNTTIANIAYSSNTDAKCPLTFTSSDQSIAEVVNGNLIIHEIGQEVKITVSQAGNDDYVARTESFTFTPCERPSLEVPFRVDYSRHATSVQLGTKCKWEDNQQIKIATTSDAILWGDDRKRVLITFAGKPDKLYFEYSSSDLATPELAQYGWEVEESPNGLDWTTVWKKSNLSPDWRASGEIVLQPTTQFIRFSYSGNFAGYLRNITISSFDGYNYLRAEEGTYLSRGAKYGTQAVVDPFGVASRVSRFTTDNLNIYTRFLFVDNMQYLWETHDTKELFTDDATAANTNNLWQIPDANGKFYIQSGNNLGNKGQYVAIVDNALTFTSDETAATIWHMETAEEHDIVLKDYMDKAAAMAAEKDFGASVNTLDKVRSNIDKQDFEITEIEVPAVDLSEQSGEYRDGIKGTLAAYDHTISNLEPGFYRLTVKALYRISTSEYAQAARDKNLESVVAYVYANDVKYPIQSIYTSYNAGSYESSDEAYNGMYYPTQLSSVGKAFEDINRYLNDVYVYVEADPDSETGTLRYGIKNPSFVPGAWLAFEEITLTLFKRKEFIFLGTDKANPTDWHTAENWNRNALPRQYHNVRIKVDANISESVDVYHMNIDESKKVTISATGGLTVGVGGVIGATDNSITIDNNLSGVGYFRIDPTATSKPSKVTVNYTPNAKSGSPRDEQWQYVGAPGKDMNMSGSGLMIYHWSEQNGWLKANTEMQPFVGYALTRTTSATDAYVITASPIYGDTTITLTQTDVSAGGMGGSNLFVNSYLAPIDLSKFEPEDFSGVVDQTFYLFNSGSWHQWQNNGGADNTIKNGSSPGQYYAISSLGAGFLDANKDQTTIPPMQGVYVVTGEGGGQINLNYEKHIYNGTATDMNRPMRAPQMHDEDFLRVRLQVNSENSGADRMYIIQHPECTKGYDNGYDARNIIAANQANIYTNEKEGQMEISFADQIDSTWIGFRAGEDSEYTLTFSSIIGEEIYLYDSDADTLLLMTEEGQYTFYAEPNSVNDARFQLLLHYANDNEQEGEGDVTDVGHVDSTTRFWINNKVLYIAEAPMNSSVSIYSASGMPIMTSYTIKSTPYTLDLSALSTGVYVLRVNNQVGKFICD